MTTENTLLIVSTIDMCTVDVVDPATGKATVQNARRVEVLKTIVLG